MRTTLLAAALFTSSLAQAGVLGLDPGLNLLAFGNFTVSGSDVEGRVAVGGNATIGGYSIDTRGSGALYAGTGLTVGGNLSFTSGAVWGDTRVGGNVTASYGGSYNGNLYARGTVDRSAGLWLAQGYTATSWTGVTGGNQWMPPVNTGSGTFDLGFDFAAQKARLSSLSTELAGLATTGTVTNQWGTLVLNAAGARIAVFDLTADQASMNMDLEGLAPDATAIINISGSSVNFGSHGYTNFQSADKRILFNLVDATSVSLTSGLYGSVLATRATVSGGSGVINGQVVVNDWQSSIQVNDAPFTGTLPAGQKVPEPATLALAGLGLALGLSRRRG